MRILLTGSSGYIGSYLLPVLQSVGHKVIPFDLASGDDITNPLHLREAFAQMPDCAIHLAGPSSPSESVSNPSKYWRTHLVGAHHLLEMMRLHRTQRLIFASSCAVYGDACLSFPDGTVTENAPLLPVSPYGDAKLECERLILDARSIFKFSFCILRLFNVAGRSDPNKHRLLPSWCRAVQNDEPVPLHCNYATQDASPVRDYVHIDDVTRAFLLATECGSVASHAINIGSGVGTTSLDMLRQFVQVSDCNIITRRLPRRSGDANCAVADIRSAKSALGWEPKHDLASIVRSAWENRS